MSTYEFWSLFWAGVSATATALTFVIVVTAAIFTYVQIREASRARQLEGALAVLTHISSPDLRNARRLIYTHHADIDALVATNPTWKQLNDFFKRISDDTVDMECFHSYLASLENVAILVVHGLAPDDIIDMYFGRLAPHHWERLAKFTQFMRSYYGSDDFLQHFEMMNQLLASDAMKSGRMKRKLLKQRKLQRKTDNALHGPEHRIAAGPADQRSSNSPESHDLTENSKPTRTQ